MREPHAISMKDGHVNNTLQNIRKAVLEAPAVRGIKIVGIDGP